MKVHVIFLTIAALCAAAEDENTVRRSRQFNPFIYQSEVVPAVSPVQAVPYFAYPGLGTEQASQNIQQWQVQARNGGYPNQGAGVPPPPGNIWIQVPSYYPQPPQQPVAPPSGYPEIPSPGGLYQPGQTVPTSKPWPVKPTTHPTPIIEPITLPPPPHHPPTHPPEITHPPVDPAVEALRKCCLKPRGQFPSPNSCYKFINCWDETVVEQDCPDGLAFNPKGYCDFPENVPCANAPGIGGHPAIQQPGGGHYPGHGEHPSHGKPVDPLPVPTHPTHPPTYQPTHPPTHPPTRPPTHPPTQRPPTHPPTQRPPTHPTHPPTPAPGYPSGPVNPGYPSGPANPGYPSGPVHPGYPSGPVNPGYPSGPVNPGYPSGNPNPNYPTNVPPPINAGYPGQGPPVTIGVPEPTLPAPTADCPNLFDRYRNPRNCSEFIVCNNGIPIVFECPPTLYYNPEIGVCDYAQNVDCSVNGQKPTHPPPPPPYNNGGYNNNIGSVNNNMYASHAVISGNPPANCQAGTVYRMNPECSSVALCREGYTEVVHCPPGLSYDVNRNGCLLPSHAKC